MNIVQRKQEYSVDGQKRGLFRKMNLSGGFTLVEGLFSCVIGAVLMGMIMILYLRMNQNMLVGVALAEVNSNARVAVDRMVRDLRWGTQLEGTHGTYTTGDSEMIIRVPSIDGTGKFILDKYDYIVYALDGLDPTVLRRVVDPDPGGASSRTSTNQVVANNVTAFLLSSEGAAMSSIADKSSITSVEISVSVETSPLAMASRTVSENIVSNVELRNK